MLPQTDLTQIKAKAKLFLMLDIQPVEKYPFIVKHLFTDSNYTLDKDSGTLVNLLEDDAALERWRTQIAKQIESADNVHRISMMLTKSYLMKVKLKLFFKWGIEFDEKHPYTVPDQGNRKVEYAEKSDIMDAIVQKYRPDLFDPPAPPEDASHGGQSEDMSDKNDPRDSSKKKQNQAPNKANQEKKDKNKSGGTNVRSGPRERRNQPLPKRIEGEVNENGQS